MMDSLTQIKIFYFSGTGNAKRIAVWLSEFAIKKGIACELTNIAKTDAHKLPEFEHNTLIIIISPIHGFNYPKITLDFIRHFPKGKNKVVLMNTRAGMKIGKWVTPGLTGIAFILSSIWLVIKGYKIMGQIPFDMPSNWISLHPALNETTVKYLHERNYERVERHATKIFAGQRDFLALRDLVQDILIAPVSLGYYFFGRFAFAKSYYASTACDLCGLCVKQCPVHAIKTIDERPYWTFDCESCMKCMNTCPQHAIETAHGLFLFISVIGSTLTTLVIDHLMVQNLPAKPFKWLIFTLIFFALLWGFYKIQHLLLRNKLATKLIDLMSFTHYKFWGRYHSIPDKTWKVNRK